MAAFRSRRFSDARGAAALLVTVSALALTVGSTGAAQAATCLTGVYVTKKVVETLEGGGAHPRSRCDGATWG